MDEKKKRNHFDLFCASRFCSAHLKKHKVFANTNDEEPKTQPLLGLDCLEAGIEITRIRHYLYSQKQFRNSCPITTYRLKIHGLISERKTLLKI